MPQSYSNGSLFLTLIYRPVKRNKSAFPNITYFKEYSKDRYASMDNRNSTGKVFDFQKLV